MPERCCISVVLATRNEERNIRRFFDSMSKQTFKDFEILVVDNNSRDETVEISRQYLPAGNVFCFMTNLSDGVIRNFRGAQLNFGVSQATGKYIFFPDADMSFDCGLLEESCALMDRFDALYIPEEVLGTGYIGRVRNFERSFYNGTCVDAIRVVKKQLYIDSGGFDVQIQFGPDDWDFTAAIKDLTNNIGMARCRIYHNEQDLNLKSYLDKKRAYMNTFGEYRRKRSTSIDTLRQFSPLYRYVTVFIEAGKWRKLLLSPNLVIGMILLRVLVGVYYIRNSFVDRDV